MNKKLQIPSSPFCAVSPNAVKHFLNRKEACKWIVAEFARIRLRIWFAALPFIGTHSGENVSVDCRELSIISHLATAFLDGLVFVDDRRQAIDRESTTDRRILHSSITLIGTTQVRMNSRLRKSAKHEIDNRRLWDITAE